ncbi:hypothetical protein AVEN_123316-1 [Araneus ventricosus]|uniref:Tesmin/TSO1-like CXC domain-containing protein n=1 Tax=Araneus ventricosus TaxID=182803 RepID=A0A4Y2KQA9_ARAVE|nr:hypothetical protein AVEN_123316-1 [Araneus ventricosus]
MPILVEVAQKIEVFCNLSFASTTQHMDASDSRISRDEADRQKLVDWFSSHEPFPKYEHLKSIASVSLPPTTIAAHEYSLRAYLHIQLWSGFAKSPIHWGWKETKHGLFPVTTYKKPAPPDLLSIISCKCSKGYNLTCTCRKSGINCSTTCYHCKVQECITSPEYDIITNSSHQEAEIDIKMEEIISEIDLEEEYQTLQVEESNSMQKEEYEEWMSIGEDIPLVATIIDFEICKDVSEKDPAIKVEDSDGDECVEKNPPTNAEMRQALHNVKCGVQHRSTNF